MMARRKAGGDSGLEALRVLKRRLSDVVYAALRADLAINSAAEIDRGANQSPVFHVGSPDDGVWPRDIPDVLSS